MNRSPYGRTVSTWALCAFAATVLTACGSTVPVGTPGNEEEPGQVCQRWRRGRQRRRWKQRDRCQRLSSNLLQYGTRALLRGYG